MHGYHVINGIAYDRKHYRINGVDYYVYPHKGRWAVLVQKRGSYNDLWSFDSEEMCNEAILYEAEIDIP